MTKLYITIAILFTLILILGGYIVYQDIPARQVQLNALTSDNEMLQQRVNDLTFQYTTAKLANNQLRLDMADRELEIIRLQAHEQAYDDMLFLFIESLSHINSLELRFIEMHDDYGYPLFTARRIMMEIINEGIE